MACREEHGIKKVEKGETGRIEWFRWGGGGEVADATAFQSEGKRRTGRRATVVFCTFDCTTSSLCGSC